MPVDPNLLNIFKFMKTANIKIAGPLIVLLVGSQILMDIKFACPCSFGWNQVESVFFLIVPPLIAFLIMLRFIMYKTETSQEQDNSGISRAQDNSETSQSKQLENYFTVFICLVPSLIWISIALIDGDYLACAATTWNGLYACDKELHPNCLNWCKPTELSPATNETHRYERTRMWINISKVLGYGLAFFFCCIAIGLSIHGIRQSNSENPGQEVQTHPTSEGQHGLIVPTTSEEQQGPRGPTMSEGQHDPTGPTMSEEQHDLTGPTMSGGQCDPTGTAMSEEQHDTIDPTTGGGQYDPRDPKKSGGEQDSGTLSEGLLPRPQQKIQSDSYHMRDSEYPTEKDHLLVH